MLEPTLGKKSMRPWQDGRHRKRQAELSFNFLGKIRMVEGEVGVAV